MPIRLKRLLHFGIGEVVQRHRFDLPQGVDQQHLGTHVSNAVLNGVRDDACGGNAATKHLGQLIRGNRHPDLRAHDFGHGDADETALRVNDRAARVARIDVTVDLDHRDAVMVVSAHARNRGPRDRDSRVPVAGTQFVAEREAEDEHRQGLADRDFGIEVDRFGHRIRFDFQDRQVAVAVQADHRGGNGLLGRRAAVKNAADAFRSERGKSTT